MDTLLKYSHVMVLETSFYTFIISEFLFLTEIAKFLIIKKLNWFL